MIAPPTGIETASSAASTSSSTSAASQPDTTGEPSTTSPSSTSPQPSYGCAECRVVLTLAGDEGAGLAGEAQAMVALHRLVQVAVHCGQHHARPGRAWRPPQLVLQ